MISNHPIPRIKFLNGEVIYTKPLAKWETEEDRKWSEDLAEIRLAADKGHMQFLKCCNDLKYQIKNHKSNGTWFEVILEIDGWFFIFKMGKLISKW